jgi:DNA-binding transcriptional LysR family regulator
VCDHALCPSPTVLASRARATTIDFALSLCSFEQVNWDDLRYFIALQKGSSLSAAARLLKTEHTTVSRRLAALEADLGVRLFERRARQYRLTPEGEKIAVFALRLEEQALDIQRIATGRQTKVGGTVRISAPPAFASHFLAERLAVLLTSSPELEIELIAENALINLARVEADIAVRMRRPDDNTIVARKVGECAFGLYASRAYLNQPRKRWTFIGYDKSLDGAPQQQWLRALAGTALRFRTNDLVTLMEGAAGGLGVAVLPRFMADRDIRLAPAPIAETPPSRPIWVLVHADLKRSPRIRCVLDHLAQSVAAAAAILNPARRKGAAG